jgi:hypothetical protein
MARRRFLAKAAIYAHNKIGSGTHGACQKYLTVVDRVSILFQVEKDGITGMERQKDRVLAGD